MTFSLEVLSPFYFTGGFSTEDKSFANSFPLSAMEVDLETTQRFLSAGVGAHYSLSESTDAFGEVLLMDTSVDHELPCFIDGEDCNRIDLLPAHIGRITAAANAAGRRPGPIEYSTIAGVLEDTRYGLRFGLRQRIGESSEITGSIGFIDIVDEQETNFTIGYYHNFTETLSAGTSLVLARTTDDNFNNIRKARFSLRLGF